MKEFISLNNVKNVRFFDDSCNILLEICYFNKDYSVAFSHNLLNINQDSKDFIIAKYEGAYVRIKNALINKEDFVEVEL
jgi:hypothetical protein